MKIMKMILLILLIIIVIFAILLFTSSNVASTDKLDKDFLVEKIVFQSDLDIYSENSIKFSEEEVNGLISPRLKDRLNSSKDSSLKFDKLYLDLKQNSIKVKGDFKNLPFVINMELETKLEKEKIIFISKKFKIGNLHLPQFLLNKLGLSNIDDSLYIDTVDFDEITITDIEIYDKNIKIDYKTNNEKIIETYINDNQQEFIKIIVNLLEKNRESRSLANSIVKSILLTSSDKDIPKTLVEDLKKDFINLDNKTKTELIFTMIKYNIDYILNIIQK